MERNNMIVLPRAGVENLFNLQVIRRDGTPGHCTGWFRNLFTDLGLNNIGTLNWGAHAIVGSGDTAPSVSDTALASLMTWTDNNQQAISNGLQTEEPYFGWNRLTRRINARASLEGTVREVGLTSGLGQTATQTRALVPTPFTVGEGESLDVTWERRLYPPLFDTTGTIMMDGVLRDYTCRAAAVTSENNWYTEIGGPMVLTVFPTKGSSTVGPLGTILQQIQGAASSGPATIAQQTYVNASLVQDFKCDWALADVGSVGAFAVFTRMGRYKFGFDPALNVTASHIMTITVRMGWGRKT